MEERVYTPIGGDLEASFDGNRYVDVRVKGNASPSCHLSLETASNVLALFPNEGSRRSVSLSEDESVQLQNVFDGWGDLVESVARLEAKGRDSEAADRSERSLDVSESYTLGFRPLLSDDFLKRLYRETVSKTREMLTSRMVGGVSKATNKYDELLLQGEFVLLVPPGGRVDLIAHPQVHFKPTRMEMDDALADCFDVVDIKVGKNSQIANASPLPGSSFKSTATHPPLVMDTAQISMQVTVSLLNKHFHSVPIPSVMMYGRCLTSEV